MSEFRTNSHADICTHLPVRFPNRDTQTLESNHQEGIWKIGKIHVGDKTLEILGPILKVSLKVCVVTIHLLMSTCGGVANHSKAILFVLSSG